MKLSLDRLTITNCTPVELIRSAHAAGFDCVSLWGLQQAQFPLHVVTPEMERECTAALADTGICVQGLEAFDIGSLEVIESYRPALELGARLGAKSAVAIHLRNPDRSKAAAALAALVELADGYGLSVNLEPIVMGQTSTLIQARDLIRAAGADAGIVLDMYHLVRVGGTAQDIRSIEPALIRHVQVNDGVAAPSRETILIEAARERPYPGEGVFPLVELLSATPTDIPWGVESPSCRRAERGMSPEAQAKEAMAALRRVIDQVQAANISA